MSSLKDKSRDQAEDQAALVKSSQPVDGEAAELALRETATIDLKQAAIDADLKTREFKDVIEQRKKWSDSLLAMVQLIIVVDVIIMFLVGLGVLKYSGDFALPAFIGSSVLEIFGLSYIVVQYLFPGAAKANGGKKRRSEKQD